MAESITPKKRVNRNKCNFATKQRMIGVLAIVEILRYRGFPIPESQTLSHPDERRSCISGEQKGKVIRIFVTERSGHCSVNCTDQELRIRLDFNFGWIDYLGPRAVYWSIDLENILFCNTSLHVIYYAYQGC